MIIKNNKYFIDQLNSSKANKMTELYHYSGVGFKKAILNLGVFRNEDSKLVGVLQWGCSYQEKIRLDRYVKEDISKNEYLELNRFCMADSEGKNSESQAISLGIKWIKKNRPEVKLLVSYAGRKEGNYGYIYQATNWEYLGYFISEGFWFVDGEERHLNTLWYRYTKHGNPNLSFIDGICDMYQDVRKTWTKQFIYIIRLDKKLTLASPVLPYPKPSTEYPIKIREHIYKQNDEIFNNYKPKERQKVEYFYKENEKLFSNSALIRRGELIQTRFNTPNFPIAMYDIGGHLENTFENISQVPTEYQRKGIKESISKNKSYKQKYFKFYSEEPEEEIEVPILCIIDEIPFNSFSEIGRYLQISRQAVHQAWKKQSKKCGGKEVCWYREVSS